jgi:hypothetical protein
MANEPHWVRSGELVFWRSRGPRWCECGAPILDARRYCRWCEAVPTVDEGETWQMTR